MKYRPKTIEELADQAAAKILKNRERFSNWLLGQVMKREPRSNPIIAKQIILEKLKKMDLDALSP